MNISEESLKKLEKIVEDEMLSTEEIRGSLEVTEKGRIRQSIQNCKHVLDHDPCLKGAICRNEMACQIDITKKVPWKRRGVQMTDTDMNNLSLYLEKNYGLTSDRVITKAVDIVANNNSFHPIIDFLEGLNWDGTPRINHMLTHFFGAEDQKYTGEIMKMHMMAAISRLYEPGTKYDIMLCLVGGQGTGKSTFFKDSVFGLFHKPCQMNTAGMTVSKDILQQYLRFLNILFVPAGAHLQGIKLRP